MGMRKAMLLVLDASPALSQLASRTTGCRAPQCHSCWHGLAGAAAAVRAAGDAAAGVTDSVSAGVSGALEGLTGAVGGVTEAGAGLVCNTLSATLGL